MPIEMQQLRAQSLRIQSLKFMKNKFRREIQCQTVSVTVYTAVYCTGCLVYLFGIRCVWLNQPLLKHI